MAEPIHELAKRSRNFGFLLRPGHHLAEGPELGGRRQPPAPDVIAREIVEDLTAAIAEALERPKNASSTE